MPQIDPPLGRHQEFAPQPARNTNSHRNIPTSAGALSGWKLPLPLAEPQKSPTSALSLLGYGHAVTRDVPKLLALAEERVARTEMFLEEQRALIDGRRAVGQDTTEASAVLLSLQELQARFIADRDRLREELEQIATE